MSIYFLHLILSLLGFAIFEVLRHSFVLTARIWYLSAGTKQSGINKILSIYYNNSVHFIMTIKLCIALAFFAYVYSAIQWARYDLGVQLTDTLTLTGITLLLSLALVILGLLLPYLLSSLCVKQVMNVLAIPFFLIYVVLTPIAKVGTKVSHWLDSLFKVQPFTNYINRAFFDKESFDNLLFKSIDETSEDTETLDKEVRILQNALEFSNIRLRDCMVPRTEIIAADKSVQVQELLSTFTETGFSKILIYDGDIDHVLGYIHSSDLFNDRENWLNHLNAVPIAPETMAARKLMKALMQTKKSMAVVVDEFGGTAGIVTLEDLVEEIFGEIEDEHDQPQHLAKKIGENEYVLSGRIEIDTLNESFGIDIPESDDYVTIAGFILHYCQRLPKLNEQIIIDKYSFKIIKVTETKIELVRLTILSAPPDIHEEN